MPYLGKNLHGKDAIIDDQKPVIKERPIKKTGGMAKATSQAMNAMIEGKKF
jgi:hypothetical protein